MFLLDWASMAVFGRGFIWRFRGVFGGVGDMASKILSKVTLDARYW